MAEAELEGMLGAVEEMRAGRGPKELDFCRYVTSGSGMTFCQTLDSERCERGQDERLAAVRASLSTAELKQVGRER